MNITQLRKLKKDYTGLKKAVASDIIYYASDYDKLEDWFNDLFEHGCVSGMIGGLIYYHDTHKFAKKHIEEILELKQDQEDDMGEAIEMKDDALNWLAWFGFEETARTIYHELGGENW